MHDLKFVRACDAKNWEHLSAIKFYSEHHAICAAVIHAYGENMQRVHGLLMLPGYSFMSGESWNECGAEAKMRCFGTYSPTPEEFSVRETEVAEIAWTLRDQLLQTRDGEDAARQFFVASHNLEVFADDFELLNEWLHDLFKTVIVQAWSAYEVLATDLYRRIDSKRPDLASSMSSTQKKIIGFKSRSKIANAYRYTFKSDNADILSSVDSTFVHSLGVCRNVIVHSGGVIDDDFIKDRNRLPKLPQLACIRGRRKGYRIKFTGDFVRLLVDATIPLGFGLVKAVDKWLIDHP